MKQYKIKEMHYTLQGEGAYVGAPIVLVRFTGCNIWNGHDEHREANAHKGMCAKWCDTDFRDMRGENGGSYTADELLEKIYALSCYEQGDHDNNIIGAVMFTGGEPFLQLDDELILKLLYNRINVLIETNGTLDISCASRAYGQYVTTLGIWGAIPVANVSVTVSPKPPSVLHESVYRSSVLECIKLVYDKQNARPYEYEHISDLLYLQPLDSHDPVQNEYNFKDTLDFVMKNPRWRLCVQNHKLWGLP